MGIGGALAARILIGGAAGDCWSGGATDHEWVSGFAIEKLPETLPAFVKVAG